MNLPQGFRPLAGDYYAACNEVFRRSTNQGSLMLEAVRRRARGLTGLSLISVGSGVGLFEIPLVKDLIANEVSIERFVGVDPDPYACRILSERLLSEVDPVIRFEIANLSFQEFDAAAAFDLVLFNHSFEYLVDKPTEWMRKALDLLTGSGLVMIFSPDRGGINEIYGGVMKQIQGFEPLFSDDIERLLERIPVDYSKVRIEAECDVSLILEVDQTEDKIRLLSFLIQADCRSASRRKVDEYSNYFLSLRRDGGNSIPHPTTLFTIRRPENWLHTPDVGPGKAMNDRADFPGPVKDRES